MKRVIFERSVLSIDLLLLEGKCCTLIELVDFILGFLEEGEELASLLRTRDVRNFLENHYGSKIKLLPNERVNESYFVYSSSISSEALAQKIKNQNIMVEARKKIREELKSIDFGLQDSFCDETNLKSSWENVSMPDCLLSFFASLFNIPKSKLFKQNISEFIFSSQQITMILNILDQVINRLAGLIKKRMNQMKKMNQFLKILPLMMMFILPIRKVFSYTVFFKF